MKSIYRLAAFLFMVLPPSVGYSENSMKLDEGVNLFAINGKEIPKDNSFYFTENEFSLPNGTNQILVSYTAEVKNGSDYELEESEMSVIKFTASDQQIIISAPRLTSTRQIEDFNKLLNWRLETPDKTPIHYKVNLLPLKGFRLGIDYERALSEFNQTPATAAIPPTGASVLPIDTIKADDTEQALILKMLQYWYKLASPETQEKFKASL